TDRAEAPVVAPDWREQEPSRREETGERRHDRRPDAELRRERRRVHGPGAAVREQNEVGRVAPLPRRDRAKGAHHRRVRELVHAARGLEHAEAQVGAQPSERLLGGLLLDREVAGGEGPGRDVAEEDVRVGDGGLVAAAAVAGGAGGGACTARADGETARGVGKGDRASAGADLRDVDRRDPDQLAAAAEEPAAGGERRADLVLLAARDKAAFDQRRLRRRAAHVERDYVLVA